MTDLRWPILQWTENLPPSQEYCDPIEERWYNHCAAYTPFGRFLVCWRTSKPHIFCIRETPWSASAVETCDSLETAKAACQQAMNDRLEQWGCAFGQPAEREVEDKELLRAYALGKSGYCYEGPDDDWPLEVERAATVAGIRAAIASCRAPVSQSSPPGPTVKKSLTVGPPAPSAAIHQPKTQPAMTDYTLTIGVNLDFSSESLAELCNSLIATVKPDGGYEKSAKDNLVRHQLVDGVWMEPRHGCHSLGITLDAIKEEITEVITNWINTSTVTTCKPTTND